MGKWRARLDHQGCFPPHREWLADVVAASNEVAARVEHSQLLCKMERRQNVVPEPQARSACFRGIRSETVADER